MKPEWCPQDMWDAAMNEAAQYVEWLEPKPEEYAQSEHVLAVSFARALIEAHQRGRLEGMEEAAKVAHCHSDDRPLRYGMDWNDGYMDGCRGAADAIRAKMEEQKELEK